MNPYVQSIRVALDNPNHVIVSVDTVLDWACKIFEDDFKCPDWRLPTHPDDDEIFVEFLGVAGAINYCFTDFESGLKFDVEYEGEIYSGSFAMGASLKRALDEEIPILSPRFLADLNEETAKHIFRPVRTKIPMLKDRVWSLNNIGNGLMKAGVGNFNNLFRESNYLAFDGGSGIVERLVSNFKAYLDVTFWRGHYLHFAKRAQLVAMMYYGRSKSSNVLPTLVDPNHIGAISDYSVPKVLKRMGVLVYHPTLIDLIERGECIPSGHEYEVAIRTQTINAMMFLLNEVNRLRHSKLEFITMAELDYWIWSQARQYSDKHHFTFTTAY